ncbi:MAG: hypothetical protein GX657_10200 [Chloroflexi bacterium]|nr:hypothetical protein [Chloroflexota bacterium]
MPDLPEYVCFRTATPITVDGRLDEEAWQRAPLAMLREDLSGDAPRQPTTMQAVWDDTYLYVAFHCEDKDIWGITTERDQPIFKQEVVEVFLDDDRDGIGYVEIEVSPLNAVLDLFMLNRDDVRKPMFCWDCEGLRSAVVVDGDPHRRGTDDRSWTVEIAIPFDEMLTAPHIPPQPGDVWRANFYRIDRAEDGDEYSAWSPTFRRNYHTPKRFGRLVFSGRSV